MIKTNKLCTRNYNDPNTRHRKPYSARTASYISNNIAKRNVFNKYITNYEVKVVISFYDFAEKLKYNINDFIQELNLIKNIIKVNSTIFRMLTFLDFLIFMGLNFHLRLFMKNMLKKIYMFLAFGIILVIRLYFQVKSQIQIEKVSSINWRKLVMNFLMDS